MKIIEDKGIMIFKNEKGRYTASISRRNQDGSYENAYFPIEFNKGVELENRTNIIVNNAWLDFYKWENEHGKGTSWKIKCNDFKVVGEKKENPFAFENVVEQTEELPFL